MGKGFNWTPETQLKMALAVIRLNEVQVSGKKWDEIAESLDPNLTGHATRLAFQKLVGNLANKEDKEQNGNSTKSSKVNKSDKPASSGGAKKSRKRTSDQAALDVPYPLVFDDFGEYGNGHPTQSFAPTKGKSAKKSFTAINDETAKKEGDDDDMFAGLYDPNEQFC